MAMTLEQLRVFIAVAERQHMTQAAQALHLAQSAVSAAIAQLEGRHGAKLFHRVGRGIELTQAGQLFLIEAKAVLARAQAADLMLSELGGLKRGTLTIQASQTIASFWLPRYLVAFRRAHPGVDIRLSIGNTAQAAAAVRAGSAELGFVEAEVNDPHLISRVLAKDQMIVVVGPQHPWASRKSIKPKDLIETEWVLREPGSGTRAVFEKALSGFGITPASLRIGLELPSNESVLAAVEAGMGATALSASAASAGLDAGLLVHVKLPLPERSFYGLHHGERHLSKAANLLLQSITAPAPRRKARA